VDGTAPTGGAPDHTPLAAAPHAAQFASAYSRALAYNAMDAAIDGTRVARPAISAVLRTFSVGAAATTILTILAAIVTAVLLGIEVADADQLPGKLATLITSVQTTTPDLKTLVGTTDGANTIYSIFVGATLPAPTNDSCDNSVPRIPPGVIILGGFITLYRSCLPNAPA
jgi:hypothetical protein